MNDENVDESGAPPPPPTTTTTAKKFKSNRLTAGGNKEVEMRRTNTTASFNFDPNHMFMQYCIDLPDDMQEDVNDIDELMMEDAPKSESSEKICCILQLPSGATVKEYKISQDGTSMTVVLQTHKLMWHHRAIHMAITEGEDARTQNSIFSAYQKVALKQAIDEHDIVLDKAISKQEQIASVHFLKPVDRERNVKMTQHNYGTSARNPFQLAFAFFEMFVKTCKEDTPQKVTANVMSFYGRTNSTRATSSSRSDSAGVSHHSSSSCSSSRNSSTKKMSSTSRYSSSSCSSNTNDMDVDDEHNEEYDEEEHDEEEEYDEEEHNKEEHDEEEHEEEEHDIQDHEINRLKNDLIHAKNYAHYMRSELKKKEEKTLRDRDLMKEALATFKMNAASRTALLSEKLRDESDRSRKAQNDAELSSKKLEMSQNQLRAQEEMLAKLNAELAAQKEAVEQAHAARHDAEQKLIEVNNENLSLRNENILVLHDKEKISPLPQAGTKRPRHSVDNAIVNKVTTLSTIVE